MVNSNEITNVGVVCDRIAFSIKRENVALPQMALDFKIHGKWAAKEVKPDAKGIKCHAVFALQSNVISGEIEITVATDFNRPLTKEEIDSKETAKICVARSAEYIVQWTANISSTMGLSPLVISVDMVRNMIKSA